MEEPQRFTWEWYLRRKDKSKGSLRITKPELSKPGPICQKAKHITEDLVGYTRREGAVALRQLAGEHSWTAV